MDKKYVLSEDDVNNLMVFLDRVSTTGHKERAAMNKIMVALSTPIEVDEYVSKDGE